MMSAEFEQMERGLETLVEAFQPAKRERVCVGERERERESF